MGATAEVVESRVADRMRRAWAQLLREFASEGLPIPNGANIVVSEDNGTLTVTASVTGILREQKGGKAAVVTAEVDAPPVPFNDEDAPPPRVKGSR